MTFPIPLTDTIKGILFHGLSDINSPGKDGSTPTSTTATLKCHLEALAWLHFDRLLPVRPDASILLRTLNKDDDDTASLRESLRSEISFERYSREMFEELINAVRKAKCATEQPSLLSARTFHYDGGRNVQQLGRLGSVTSAVFAMSYTPLNTVVACKALLLREKVAAATTEADILKTLEHPNVVKFFGYQRIDHEALVFMEFIDGGTVEALAETLGGLDESDAALFTTQILHGLAYLHGQQIIHRSLRGANILVTLQGRIKITEVGCASPIDMKHRVPVNFEASLYSMSPEMIQDQDYNSRTDIWSLGNVILELIVGGHPWKHEDKGLVYVLRDIAHRNMPIPDNISVSLRHLLSTIFQPQESRPTAEALFSDSWIARPGNQLEFKGVFDKLRCMIV